MGAKLFEPRNYHEDKFVMNLTKQNDIEAYWIGINRRLDGKSVYSSDNTSLSWSHFEALAKPEKQHTPLCTVISFNNGMGGWKDKDCSLKRHSVCDKHIGKPFFIFPKLPNQLVQKITPISFLACMFQLFFLSYLELYRLIHILQDEKQVLCLFYVNLRRESRGLQDYFQLKGSWKPSNLFRNFAKIRFFSKRLFKSFNHTFLIHQLS